MEIDRQAEKRVNISFRQKAKKKYFASSLCLFLGWHFVQFLFGHRIKSQNFHVKILNLWIVDKLNGS